MNILVTGGAGFIGSHVVDEYINAGHNVIVIDNLYSGKMENLNPKAKFYQIDIRDKEVENIIENENIDIINHHAAQISVPDSTEKPDFDAEINILGTINLLKAAVLKNVKRFIFSSTGGAIYGDTDYYPYSEESIPYPLSPYAVAKLSAEHYIRYFASSYLLNFVILRYANVYGPRQIPQGEAGVVSIFIDKMRKNQEIFIYSFPESLDGMVRDYVYVKDIAKANLLALTKGDNQEINISTNKEIKTLDLFMIIKETLNSKSEYKIYPPRPGDIKRSCLKNEKALKVLGWKPEFNIKEGIKDMVKNDR
jgi:UDP-glucose 4-epimerase